MKLIKAAKKIGIFSLMVFITSAFSGTKDDAVINDTCNKEEAVEKCKVDLNPFRYNGVKTTTITSKPFDQVLEVAMPMYFDTEYRFVFNLEGLQPEIKVQIFDKTMRDPNRKLVFESSAKHFQFEPGAANQFERLYINYVIPPVPKKEDNTIEKGCVVLTTGFKNV